eukprot:XP_001699743.1 predicted protein [Chlamydomonas reinhardtii]
MSPLGSFATCVACWTLRTLPRCAAGDDEQGIDVCAFMNSGGDAPVPQTPTSRERSAPQPFIAERLATSTEPPGPSPWGLHPPLHTAVPVLPPISSTKQPNLAAVGENDPYPPANAEVTLELQRQTLKHGRKLIQYSASRPLDTIHIKIPNTSPGLLTQPVLANLCHIIDLGHQRIVVGGSLRPGCALLSLDLMDLALDASQLLAVLGVVRAATAVPLSSRVQLQAGGAVWEGTFVPVRPDADGAVQGPEQAAEPGRPAGPAQAGDTGGSTTRGQWQWQRLDPWQDSIGWDASSRVAEDGGVFVDAAAPPPTSARASPMSSAETARVEGGAAPDPSAPLPLRRSLHGPSPAAAEPRVQLWVTRQVMLAPAAAGQPLQLSVRVSGLPALGNTSAPLAAHEQAQAAGAGRRAQGGGAAGAVVDGPVSSYAFAVRSLGRYLPVHGVPAPMTPPAAGAPTGEPQAGAAHVTRPGSPGLTGFAASAPGVGCPASPPRTTSAGGLRCSSGLLPTSAFVTEAGLPSGRSSSNGSPVSGASAADLEAAVQAAAAASAPSTGTGTGEEAAVQQAGALRSPSPVNPDGCFELSVAGLGPAAAAAAATAGSSRPHEWQPGPQLVQLELWRDGARVQVASKPLLLLPPGEAALAAELQRLVALQDELSQENGMAAAAAAVAGSALQPPGPSPADQLVSDLGQWLEFVHAELQLSSVPAAAAAPQPAEAQSPPPVLLRGSVDLRDQVLGMRRAAPGYGSSMLCLGMELLEAAVQLRSSTLAGTVMACFGALGYSVAEVWASLGEVDTSEVEAGAVAQGEAREAGAAARLPVLLALVEATGGDADVAGLVQDWAAQAALAAAASAIPAVRAEEAQPAQPAPASSASGASWVCVHLALMAAAVLRLASDGRLGLDLPAVLLFSGAYVIMTGVVVADRLRPGLLARHRLACWMMTSMLRSSAKLPQLVGWVLVPPSTLTHVRAGTTLVADCVLPAAFEPLPPAMVLLVSLWDVVMCIAFYRHIGHESALHVAVFKLCLSLLVRFAVDVMYRVSFVRAEARAATPTLQGGVQGKGAGSAAVAATSGATAHKEHLE